MTNTLDEAIIKLIEKTSSGIDQAVGFLSSEIPDVVYQLLLWYGVYNFIYFLLGVILLILLVVTWVKYSGQRFSKDGRPLLSLTHTPSEYKQGKGEGEYKWDVSPHVLVSCLISFVLLIVLFGALLNLTWLKIWIAPKVWLIEYARNLV